MLVGLYKIDKPAFEKQFNSVYKKILSHNNIPFIELSINQPDFWEKVKELDLFVFRWAQPDDHHQLA